MRELARVLGPAGCWSCASPRSISCAAATRTSSSSGRDSPAGADATSWRGAGIRVLRCTYANSLLMPVALAKFRLWEPLLRRPRPAAWSPCRRWLDRLLYAAAGTEAAWIGAAASICPSDSRLLLIGEKVA